MLQPSAVTIDDPQCVPTYAEGPIARWCRKSLVDPRDEVFVRLTLRSLATQIVAFALVYAGYHYTRLPGLVTFAAYVALWAWTAPPVILMLHCTMHRKFIKEPKFLDDAHPLVMAFFYGMPMGYREHHIGMHHVEDNGFEDLSSTLSYRRDSFLHFLVYFSRFFFLIVLELPRYLRRERTASMARRALYGEIVHWAIMGAALALDWRFALTVFVMPYVVCRFMMMMGNWGQHAFINTARPNNGIANAITCINSDYNKRCFNDGYHVGHHMRAKRHWSELPADFIANQELYAREGVIVFQGLDFFFVSLLLWLGAWKLLAKRYVRLAEPRTDEDVIAMLKARVQPVRSWPAAG
jgi:fatty acid desaturase